MDIVGYGLVLVAITHAAQAAGKKCSSALGVETRKQTECMIDPLGELCMNVFPVEFFGSHLLTPAFPKNLIDI